MGTLYDGRPQVQHKVGRVLPSHLEEETSVQVRQRSLVKVLDPHPQESGL